MFSNIELLLLREAALASGCLGCGLTDIGRYSPDNNGYFYNSLFTFSIGLERVAKLVLIYDYKLNHTDAVPDNNYIKGYSHDLKKLLGKVNEIHDSFGLNLESNKIILNDNIYTSIINILSDFAKGSRYYNLDQLTGSGSITNEPLKLWEEQVASEIINRHFEKPKVQLNEQFYKDFGNSVSVIAISDNGSPINDLKELIEYGNLIPTKQKYSKYYLLIIANYLTSVLKELEFKGNFFPCLREFFEQFIYLESKEKILSRKSWRER